MEHDSLQLWAAVLLLVGGLVHLIPNIYSALTALTGDFPWIQLVVGVLSVIVALVMFASGEKADIAPSAVSGSTPQEPPQQS
ncbi:MAG: hypothetical protein COT71_02935 [Candidatus Andersenbacteria bacterium CG10_big_fil_rev_8_21_14_0_10_54_11]|uniref:Uncharacterized protein n=1 Tax=Candidatus Andersenbacteria bacterium CG10_big_fil_rev_8_21_14_0_10_54_11 TaxID=1974485 RepID=A0A2M6WYZ0_9BACT|nr:MAG: hypothetical protein COT71_02935 [Candidatus Andersenbacteria bacterium CG10_big_fil_rev_8_21_14_0_10_54_11]